MNFKRFHESKNLFDGTLIGGVFTDADWAISPIVSTTTYKSIKVYLSAGTYTFGFEIPVNIVRTVIDGQFAQAYDTNVTSYTITITANGYVGISFRANASSTEPWDNSNIMLNSGSTPQPYEPYSSEVWHDIPHYIHKTDTDILITLPDVVYVNDTTATVGLKGDMSQSLAPTPTNPIQPQETGERTGNLFSEPLVNGYTLDGTTGLPKSYTKRCSILNPLDVSDSQNVTITFTATLNRTRIIYSLFNDTTLIRRVTAVSSGSTIDVSEGNNLYISFYDIIDTVTVSSNDISNLMLNAGSTPLPYEPPGYKIPISSASTTTPVYLGEVQTTRRIKKLVLTGDETAYAYEYSGNNGYSIRDVLDTSYSRAEGYCSHYVVSTATPSTGTTQVLWIGASNAHLYFVGIADIIGTTSGDEFKQWLAQQYANGTPVTVWYVLATETTGIVNEPLRKIGGYADEVSGITIPTIAGANTLSVDTTLQPSEVTVNYKGWHPVQSVHEAENGQWD